jgi:ABC-2 type transport system permease protein
MKKMFAVCRREYLQAVRKKMFIFMTLFFPVLMAGIITLPMMMMMRALGEKKIAVVDATGRLGKAFQKKIVPDAPDPKAALRSEGRNDLPQTLSVEYVDARGGDIKTAAKPYLGRLASDRKDPGHLDAILAVPANAFSDSESVMTFYSRGAADIMTQERLGSIANRAIQRERLTGAGISPDLVDKLTRRVPVDGVQLSRSGAQKKGSELNLFIGFIFAALLVLPSFVYGVEIMRGVIQEKNDRIVEILISSMTPRELLTGKIVGIGLVGLTQISVWLLMMIGVATFGATTAAVAGIDVFQFLRPSVFVYFAIFFVLAYFTFVCVYAVAGASCNSDKEAQQLMAPIQIVMMLPWFLMMAIITNPDSSLAVGLSLAPVYGPITMFVRALVSEPPLSQVLTSIAVSLVTVTLFFWAAAKIFRVGILSYGKRPTIPELWRWLRVA